MPGIMLSSFAESGGSWDQAEGPFLEFLMHEMYVLLMWATLSERFHLTMGSQCGIMPWARRAQSFLQGAIPARWVGIWDAFIKRTRGNTCIEDKSFQPPDPTHLICGHDSCCICCFLETWKTGSIQMDQLWALGSSVDHFTFRSVIKLFVMSGMAFMPWFAVSSGRKPIQWQELSLWPSSKHEAGLYHAHRKVKTPFLRVRPQP